MSRVEEKKFQAIMNSRKQPSWMREDWPALAKPPLYKLSDPVKRRLFDAAKERRFAVKFFFSLETVLLHFQQQ